MSIVSHGILGYCNNWSSCTVGFRLNPTGLQSNQNGWWLPRIFHESRALLIHQQMPCSYQSTSCELSWAVTIHTVTVGRKNKRTNSFSVMKASSLLFPLHRPVALSLSSDGNDIHKIVIFISWFHLTGLPLFLTISGFCFSLSSLFWIDKKRLMRAPCCPSVCVSLTSIFRLMRTVCVSV
jgi:hypothetical protein